MKCFKCGSKCLTNYHERLDNNGVAKIVAVSKNCMNCDWSSYPTQIPSKLE